MGRLWDVALLSGLQECQESEERGKGSFHKVCHHAAYCLCKGTTLNNPSSSQEIDLLLEKSCLLVWG